jgi:hypothetical protein
MLNGNLPDSIGKLRSLVELYLANNQFSGNIPPTLENLKNLQRVDFSGNRLKGRIPKSMAKMPMSSFLGNRKLCGSPLLPCKPF